MFDADRVLLVKRGREPLKGEWSLPGGAVEVGETLEAAVAREVLEETGCTSRSARSSRCSIAFSAARDGRVEYHFVIVDYLCRPRGGHVSRAPMPRMRDGFRWPNCRPTD